MASRDLTAEFAGFDVVVDGASVAMQITEITPPAIERLTQTSRPGGSVGSIKSNHGLSDDLKLMVKATGYSIALERLGSAQGIGGVTIIGRGAWSDKKTGDTFTDEITMRGRVAKWQRHGNWKQGEEVEAEFELDLVFYEELRAGNEVAFIDIESGQWRMGGSDQAPGQSALFG